MNPKYSDLIKSTISTHSSTGEYVFTCTSASRGRGTEKYVLEIEGIGEEPDLSVSQFHFDFNGKSYGAGLEIIGRHQEMCKVQLSTIVSDPAFWS